MAIEKQQQDEEPGEEWCFECKDGGNIVICDYRNCGKVYHPACVNKDHSFFDTAKSWVCGRHFCFECNELSKFLCIGCPKSVCRKCFAASDFTVVRGLKGLCIDCSELAEIIERNLNHDSEGNKITLDDRETYECLFKEYWEIVKVQEGLTSDDILAALPNYEKSKKNCNGEEEKQNNSMSRVIDEDSKPAKWKRYSSEVKEGLTGDVIFATQPNYKKGERFLHRRKICKAEEKKLKSWQWDIVEDYKPAKRKWYNSEVKEGLTNDDIFAAQPNYKKGKKNQHHNFFCKGEEKKNDLMSMSWEWNIDKDYKPSKGYSSEVKEGLTSDDIFAAQPNCKNGKGFLHHKIFCRDEEKQNDSMSRHSDEDYMPAEQKRYNSEEFAGWGSKFLISFLASIGKYESESLSQSDVSSLIHEYIKEKNLHHPKDKGKFLADESLFPIFGKKVMSKSQIYPLLEFHIAKKLDDSSVEKNDDKIENSSTDNHVNDQTRSMKSRLLSLIGKPPLKKGDFFIKPSRFASVNANNINLIYLKRSLLLELSKQPESFIVKAVGTFVRAKVDSDDNRQRKSYHLVRVLGVVFDEMSNGTLLEVSFMDKAVHISVLSDEDFTEHECEDLQQKVKASLLPKLTVVEVQEKAEILHEDITKHRILTRLVYLQNQIDRANLRGRNREKIELLEEKEQLEQSWKQGEPLKNKPSVRPELIEAKYDVDSEEEIDTWDQ